MFRDWVRGRQYPFVLYNPAVLWHKKRQNCSFLTSSWIASRSNPIWKLHPIDHSWGNRNQSHIYSTMWCCSDSCYCYNLLRKEYTKHTVFPSSFCFGDVD